ncbi:MAG: hypothetical protein ACI4F4_02505 [Lachnospiraceae bacterium]
MKIASLVMFVPLMGCIIISVLLRNKVDKDLSGWQLFMKYHMFIFIVLLVGNIGCFLLANQEKNSFIVIEKEDYEGDKTEVSLKLNKNELEKNITLNVSQRQYSKDEAYEKMEEAFLYLEQHMKGKNKSLDYVTTDLNFFLDKKAYPFELECVSDHYGIIDNEGIVKNDKDTLKKSGYSNMEDGILVQLKITLYYEVYRKEKTFSVRVYEKEEREDEAVFTKVEESLKQIEKNALGDKTVIFPTVMDGVTIERTDHKGVSPWFPWLLGIAVAGLLLFREIEEKQEKEKKRRMDLQRCYPWFVNEMVLLLGSGMQVKNIFSLLVSDYKKQKEENLNNTYQKVLIDELEIACHSFRMGMSEETIYYQLGRRLKLPCYIKLMTLLEQNVKKGAKGITAIMEQEEQNALETRKNMAKKYGEEAGTRLLGPMMLLLLIIMMIIMFPAFMSFQ